MKCSKVRGGSFKTFYKYHPSTPRYLVLVSRAASGDMGQETHRVSIGEIEKVVPRLADESFVQGGVVIWLTGEATLKTETVQPIWCSIPAYQGEFFAIAEEVSIGEYGPEQWNNNDSE